jgi:hypothetical protein
MQLEGKVAPASGGARVVLASGDARQVTAQAPKFDGGNGMN